ncbi:allatostatins MIP [Anthonomus grandis grandis]|uniref:allatostatins MIP n=1 Tax=Anthonomus grandis grandis TaxID=2921223 RepID=UPI002165B9F9|nr:allatostatins MIP [Anthonomus grandis grandis]
MFGPWPLAVCKVRTSDIFVYTLLLGVCFVLAESGGSNEELTRKSEIASDENPQAINEYSKRGWKTDLPMWGKRAWSNLHPGWGKRDFLDSSDEEDNYIPQYFDKRAWQRLQGGWGKRFIPSEDDMVIRQLVAALEENDNENNIDYFPDQEVQSSHQVNKRNWKSFSDGWGKRSNKWEKFRGSWGKRQPAWNNLKGLWGKRSVAE